LRRRAPAGGSSSLNQLMIVIGISVSFFSNYFLVSLGAQSWRWMLGVQVIPAALYFLLLLLVPESPRWLLSKRREQSALPCSPRYMGALRRSASLLTSRPAWAASHVGSTCAGCLRGGCAGC